MSGTFPYGVFNFDFLMSSWDPKDLRGVIDDSLAMLGAVGAPATWVLSNHDVVRHPSRYGRKAARRWVANETYRPEGPLNLELGTRRARGAALLMLALPGGAYDYQGEELGLPEVEDLPEAVLQVVAEAWADTPERLAAYVRRDGLHTASMCCQGCPSSGSRRGGRSGSSGCLISPWATQIPVPERISVLGFDDQPLAAWFDLSTVSQSPSDIGREAGELALSLINDPDADHKRHLVLPTHVIPRATTAPPPIPRNEREGRGESAHG
ncbi:substrate-binding domain-containing protein [Streptomyces sp. NPDC020794]|uniref:substrate-binding domain-containing protein n=1 Tax=unclassified Streptomyces TaxID=2593676 RepID=UPI0036E35AA9